MAVEQSRSGLAPDLSNPGVEPMEEPTDSFKRSPSEAFADVARQFGELRSYVSYFISAKLDGIKLSVRNVVIYAGLGIVGLVMAGALITTATALLCVGLAWALSALFGVAWLGPLLVGLLILGGIGAGVYFGVAWFMKATRTQMVHKYEQLRNQQRADFGHDIRDRAEQSA